MSLAASYSPIKLLVSLTCRVVKLSSPNLNYIIIAGVALLYTSVFMYTYTAEEAMAQTLICNVSTMSRKKI